MFLLPTPEYLRWIGSMVAHIPGRQLLFEDLSNEPGFTLFTVSGCSPGSVFIIRHAASQMTVATMRLGYNKDISHREYTVNTIS